MSRKFFTVAFFILIFLSIIYIRFVLHQTIDDAFITYTYSRNLAQGNGLVFNPGEKVMGFTSLLYTLLISFFYFIGIKQIWFLSLVLDCIFVPAYFFLVWLLVEKRILIFIPFMLFIFLYPHNSIPVAGMETGLFILLMFLSLYLIISKKFTQAAICSVLFSLTRPEGYLIFPILFIFSFYDFAERRVRDKWYKYLLVYLVPIVLVMIVLTLYYGSPVPQTVLAKRIHQQVDANMWPAFIRTYYKRAFDLPQEFGRNWLFFLEIVGLIFSLMPKSKIKPVGIYAILYVLFMWIGKAPTTEWYFTPIFILRYMLLFYGLEKITLLLIEKISEIFHKKNWRQFSPIQKSVFQWIFIIIIVFSLGYANIKFGFRVRKIMMNEVYEYSNCKKYRDAGEWIKNNSDREITILANEIGYISFFSERPVYDVMGLVTPDALKYLGKKNIMEVALIKKPEFIILNLGKNEIDTYLSGFQGEYQIVRSFQYNDTLTYIFKYNKYIFIE